MDKEKVTILLIEKSNAEASKIRCSLNSLMEETCIILHYSCPQKAKAFLKQENSKIDIILLDLTILDDKNPKHVFRKVNSAGQETPVIVFTDRDDHELAKSVVTAGAADSVSMEIFHAHPERLRDAIIFSLARNNVILDIKAKMNKELEVVNIENQQMANLISGSYSLEENL